MDCLNGVKKIIYVNNGYFLQDSRLEVQLFSEWVVGAEHPLTQFCGCLPGSSFLAEVEGHEIVGSQVVVLTDLEEVLPEKLKVIKGHVGI